jgi:signal transduction histidine kinase
MIVQNLLDNAAKYSFDWGSIFVSFDEKGIVVRDSGCGISQNHLWQIRDKFWQEDISRTDRKSFGLWLYLVKKLVDMHGWKIKVESEKGKGTFFNLIFHI